MTHVASRQIRPQAEGLKDLEWRGTQISRVSAKSSVGLWNAVCVGRPAGAAQAQRMACSVRDADAREQVLNWVAGEDVHRDSTWPPVLLKLRSILWQRRL